MGFFDTVGAAQVAKREVRMGVFVKLDVLPEAANYWTGTTSIEVGGDPWRGLNKLLSIPTLNQLVNGKASRITLGMEGVSAEAVTLAIRDREQVVGRELQISVAYFGDDWEQPITGLYRVWTGFMDVVPISRTGETRSIGVEAASILSTRKRAALSNYSDIDQQTRYPGDRFFERTALYRYSDKKWPIF
ncbi:MAG: hypothetical protein J0H11_14995 [Rhizobiales bacterium]|nr:hypothetical protein [Hyphomicrobiales bacterium]